ncbi:MAG TPA: 1-deoxy-D-xylulose-5-phosphate synthase, partial [Chromatiales bacterium]|nr:1-deoxy-D-xylulose-5-phosphate synthase [Chromatiales bacterium]
WPRGAVEPAPEGAWPECAWGRWEVLKPGREVYLLTFGKTLGYALEAAAADPRVGVVNARFLKPLDRETLAELADGHALVTVEDHQLAGGFGAAVLEALEELGLRPEVRRLGLPDRFTDQGKVESLHAKAGIDAAGIRRALAELGVNVNVSAPRAG